MTIKVNPPPFLRVPKAFLADREVRAFVEQQNTIMFQLWNRTGGEKDKVAGSESISTNGFSSHIQQINKELDGLPEFTMDTTGFTMDSTKFTMDKVIA